MKNFTLLFSALAVASSALAVTPQVNENLPKVQVCQEESSKATLSMVNGGKVIANDDAKKVVAKAAALSVSYEAPEGLFALGVSEELSGFSDVTMRKGPAYKPLTWTNTTVGASDFEWSFTTFDDHVAGTGYSSDVDLTRSEVYSSVNAPILTAVSEDGDEGSYQIDPNLYGFAYGGESTYTFSSGENELGMTTYIHKNDGFSYFSCMAYDTSEDEDVNPETGLYNIFTDADGYGFSDVEFLGYANLFGTPAAPYYISKMWCWMFLQAKKNTVAEMTLYKIDEEGYITDEILASGSANISASLSASSKVVSFDLYALDEDGLEVEGYITIDCPFMAIMKLNKEDFIYANAVANTGAQYPANQSSPYTRNAFIAINADGEDYYLRSPYSYYTDNTYSTLMSITDWFWMVDATFPWIYEENDQNEVTVSAEGGDASFSFQSWFNLAGLDYELSDGADEWLDFANATVGSGDNYAQILTIPVLALPDGLTGRSATVTITGPAVEYVLTINQGDVNGVKVVKAENGAVYYDLAGRRVLNPDKGIYIKVSGNKSEKVIL